MMDHQASVLIVDDDKEMRNLVCDVLTDRGHHCVSVSTGQQALQELRMKEYTVVLTDLRMQGMAGTELLTEVKRTHPDIGVILMTAFGSVETAVEAMKHGASDYLTKPVKTEELARVVERVVRETALRQEVNRLRKELHKEYSFHQILGKSKAMQAVVLVSAAFTTLLFLVVDLVYHLIDPRIST